MTAPTDPAAPGNGTVQISRKARDLVCSLAYLHLYCGHHRDAVALLRTVEPSFPDDIGVLRLMSYALIKDGQGQAAVARLEHLAELDDETQSQSLMALLRSQALMISDRPDEARKEFRRYLSLRSIETRDNHLPGGRMS